MASSLKKLSHIHERVIFAVYGWIRKMEDELRIYHIPLIMQICILFYDGKDTFDKIGHAAMKSEDDKRVTMIESISLIGDSCAFGRFEIDSTEPIEYKWDLNIHSPKGLCVIGITSLNFEDFRKKISSATNAIWLVDGIHYFYYGYGTIFQNSDKIWVAYGDGYRESKVSIILNLKKKEIKFIVDGKHFGAAYSNVKTGKDIKYRLMVTCKEKGDFIEIENFESN